MRPRYYQVHEDKLSTIFIRELLCFLVYICLVNLSEEGTNEMRKDKPKNPNFEQLPAK